jgi:hypothetical protein
MSLNGLVRGEPADPLAGFIENVQAVVNEVRPKKSKYRSMQRVCGSFRIRRILSVQNSDRSDGCR